MDLNGKQVNFQDIYRNYKKQLSFVYKIIDYLQNIVKLIKMKNHQASGQLIERMIKRKVIQISRYKKLQKLNQSHLDLYGKADKMSLNNNNLYK